MIESIRIDVLIMEKLSSSEHVANVFGYCSATTQQESFINDMLSAIITKNKKGSKCNDTTKVFYNEFMLKITYVR